MIVRNGEIRGFSMWPGTMPTHPESVPPEIVLLYRKWLDALFGPNSSEAITMGGLSPTFHTRLLHDVLCIALIQTRTASVKQRRGLRLGTRS